jgi:hypothetical protein
VVVPSRDAWPQLPSTEITFGRLDYSCSNWCVCIGVMGGAIGTSTGGVVVVCSVVVVVWVIGAGAGAQADSNAVPASMAAPSPPLKCAVLSLMVFLLLICVAFFQLCSANFRWSTEWWWSGSW